MEDHNPAEVKILQKALEMSEKKQLPKHRKTASNFSTLQRIFTIAGAN